MKRVTPGFTLIEWTIYFFLIMVVITGMFQYVAGVRHHLVGLALQSGALSQLSAAQDACVRDVSTAAGTVDRWHELGPSSLVWQSGQKICSWSVEAGALMRREKVFDPTHKEWRVAHKSVVARGNVQLHVVPIYARETTYKKEPILAGIELSLSCEEAGKKQRVYTMVAIKNGRV